MENIKITLETLYDILRNEKKKADLQKLEDTFFIDVISYLREKKALLGHQSEEDELFAAGEKEKVEYELRSIKRILKEIYEKREKKIIDIAMNKSRTGSDIIDTSSMLREEKEFYNTLLKSLDFYRRGVLSNLFRGELPDISGSEVKRVSFEKKIPTVNDKASSFSKFEGAPSMAAEDEAEEAVSEKEEEKIVQEEQKPEKKKVRFVHPMPSFVWKDMKVYGPFDIGEEVEIFPEVAELLVRKGRAEII